LHLFVFNFSSSSFVILHVLVPAPPFRYWCRYAGKPDLCQAYGVKSSQYWKQLVGKLKKRGNACEGEKVLKAKTCKKAPAEAHMKLAERSGEEEKKGGKEGGKKKGAAGGKNSDGGKVEKRKSPVRQKERSATMRVFPPFFKCSWCSNRALFHSIAHYLNKQVFQTFSFLLSPQGTQQNI